MAIRIPMRAKIGESKHNISWPGIVLNGSTLCQARAAPDQASNDAAQNIGSVSVGDTLSFRISR